jgi:hypothetical protein
MEAHGTCRRRSAHRRGSFLGTLFDVRKISGARPAPPGMARHSPRPPGQDGSRTLGGHTTTLVGRWRPRRPGATRGSADGRAHRARDAEDGSSPELAAQATHGGDDDAHPPRVASRRRPQLGNTRRADDGSRPSGTLTYRRDGRTGRDEPAPRGRRHHAGALVSAQGDDGLGRRRRVQARPHGSDLGGCAGGSWLDEAGPNQRTRGRPRRTGRTLGVCGRDAGNAWRWMASMQAPADWASVQQVARAATRRCRSCREGKAPRAGQGGADRASALGATPASTRKRAQ